MALRSQSDLAFLDAGEHAVDIVQGQTRGACTQQRRTLPRGNHQLHSVGSPQHALRGRVISWNEGTRMQWTHSAAASRWGTLAVSGRLGAPKGARLCALRHKTGPVVPRRCAGRRAGAPARRLHAHAIFTVNAVTLVRETVQRPCTVCISRSFHYPPHRLASQAQRCAARLVGSMPITGVGTRTRPRRCRSCNGFCWLRHARPPPWPEPGRTATRSRSPPEASRPLGSAEPLTVGCLCPQIEERKQLHAALLSRVGPQGVPDAVESPRPAPPAAAPAARAQPPPQQAPPSPVRAATSSRPATPA